MLPVTESVPVAVMFAPVIFPVANMLPTTDSFSNGVVVPIPTNPVLVNVVVAVPPMYAEYADRIVDDEFANCCSDDQEFAVVVPNASEIVLAEFCRGYENVRDDCLLLNVVQSDDDRHPACDPDAISQDIDKLPPITYLLDVVVIPPVDDTVPVATDDNAPVPVPYSISPDVNDVAPVPPPDTVSVPDVEGVNVSVLPDPTTVIADVNPFVVFVDVAITIADPVCDWFVGPIDVSADKR